MTRQKPVNPEAESRTAASTDGGSWTTRRLLSWMTGYLESKSVESARLCAELLLGHIIGCERLRLYMDPDRPASPQELTDLRALVTRAGRNEPIAYLLGEWWFFGMPFTVTPATLIPRPSTETLVEFVIQTVRAARLDNGQASALRVADIGTGSGCIAVALARHVPGIHVLAADISPEALRVAKGNAQRHGVSNLIEFVEGSLTMPLEDAGLTGALDFVLSNPPYISDPEWAEVEPNVRDYEPVLALRAGPDGLDYIRPLIEHGPAYLKPGGWLAIEVGASQGNAVLLMAQNHADLEAARILPDHEELPRVLVAHRAQ